MKSLLLPVNDKDTKAIRKSVAARESGALQQTVVQMSTLKLLLAAAFHRNSVVVQLVPQVEVAVSALRHLHIHQSFRLLSRLGRLVILPQSAAVRASDIALSGFGPEVKAFLMDVVAARCTAPCYLVVFSKLHAAYRAVILDRLAVAIVCFLLLNDRSRQGRRIFRDLLELGGEESILERRCSGALST